MFLEPKSATTTNNDSNKVVVSGNTETPEVIEKKKRGVQILNPLPYETKDRSNTVAEENYMDYKF